MIQLLMKLLTSAAAYGGEVPYSTGPGAATGEPLGLLLTITQA